MMKDESPELDLKIRFFMRGLAKDSFSEKYISRLEDIFASEFLLETAIDSSDSSFLIFYNRNPDLEKGHSHYFKINPRIGSAHEFMISCADIIENISFLILEAQNGELIFSRRRHEYCISKDETVFIDGGRAYTRSNMNIPESRKFLLSIKDGKWLRS